MKSFYDKYVNGANTPLKKYGLFRWTSEPPPASNPPDVVGTGRRVEIHFERSDIFVIEQALPTVVSIILHGSRASGEMAPFSDVDIAVILDDLRPFPIASLKNDVLTLRQLCRAMYTVDPLMHHGLMFANASDLLNYDQTFLPLATLAEAKCLYGARSLAIFETPGESRLGCQQRLHHSLSSLSDYDFSIRRGQQDYTLKSFLAGILLIPALFLAANGIFVHKRDTFPLVYTEFAALNWEAVKLAENLRKQWQAPRLHPGHALALSFFSGQAQSLARYFYKQNYRRLKPELPQLQALAQRLKLSLERFEYAG